MSGVTSNLTAERALFFTRSEYHLLAVFCRFSDPSKQFTLIEIILIIYHGFLPPLRRGSNVKSDYARTIVKHTLLSPYTSHLRLVFGSFALFTAYPNCIMLRYPTPLQVIIHQIAGGRSEIAQGQAIMAS